MQLVETAQDFGQHWVNCAMSLENVARETGSLIVRHELLGDIKTAEAISNHLGFDVDSSILSERVGSSKTKYLSLPWRDRKKYERLVGDLAAELNYFIPKE